MCRILVQCCQQSKELLFEIMLRIIVLFLMLMSRCVVQGVKCYSCAGASSNAECNKQGLVECPKSEDWCQTEIRTRVNGEFEKPTLTIRKGCKQQKACLNNEAQNNRTSWPSTQCNNDLDSPLSVCRYCCSEGDGCNEGLKDHDCGEIQPPQNAEYVCEPDNRYFSSECFLQCLPGFLKQKEVKPVEKVCTKNGSWSVVKRKNVEIVAQEFSCVWDGVTQIGYPFCDIFAPPPNSKVDCSNGECNGKECDLLTECKLSCEKGFTPRNISKAVCTQTDPSLDALWDVNPVELKCDPITCPQLSVPEWGTMNCSSNGSQLYQSECVFGCLDGFNLNGSDVRKCQEDGSWSGVEGNCTGVTCPDVPNPPNGSTNCYKYVGAFGVEHFCVVDCEFGFEVKGDVLYTCLPDGTWSETNTTCEAITCPELDTPAYGVLTCYDLIGPNSVGSECTTTCDAGTFLKGFPINICMENGVWSGSSASCLFVKCPDIASPENGITECIGEFGPFTYSAVCSVSCAIGYKSIGPDNKTCLASGTWSGDQFQCQSTACPVPLVPQYGSIECSGENHIFTRDSVCELSCLHGTTVVGSKQIWCQENGTWSGENQLCKRAECPLLNPPENGSLNCKTQVDNFSIVEVCNVTCNKGFDLVGSNTTHCLVNGTWSDEIGVCGELQCEEIGGLKNGRLACNGGSSYLSTCAFECDKSYQLIGNTSAQCQENGKWSNPLPTCTALPCMVLPIVTNGFYECDKNVDESGNYYVGSICKPLCNVGYKSQNLNDIFCQNTTTWTEQAGVCILLEDTKCIELPSPANGIMECILVNHSYNVGSVCQFACDYGYLITGSDTTTCLETGDWSHSLPSCEVDTCKELQPPQHGMMDCQFPETHFSVDSSCWFLCESGYSLVGNTTTKCLNTGKWSNVVPTCKRVLCENLVPPDGGLMFCENGFNANSTCTVACEYGFDILGPQFLKCLENGTWNETSPICQRLECSSHGLTNGFVTCNNQTSNFLPNTTCLYSCEEGFSLSGNDSNICQPNSTWLFEPPRCNRNCSWQWGSWSNCSLHGLQHRNPTLVYPKNNNCLLPDLFEEQACCESRSLFDASLDLCYKFNCDSLTWKEAVGSCETEGGNLLKVTSFEQHEFLRAYMRKLRLGAYWIGLNDIKNESQFEWSDGSPLLSYSQWFLRIEGNFQPDNYNDEDCVKMTPGWKTIGYTASDYDWNDSDCSSKAQYICQIPCDQVSEIR